MPSPPSDSLGDEVSTAPVAGLAAIVLAGGRSRRFGTDKLAADVNGTPLLDAALKVALQVASPVVVVGPDDRVWPAGVIVVREEPAYAGPFAAVVTGAAALGILPRQASAVTEAWLPSWVLVLAGDLVDPAPLIPALLLARSPDTDVAIATDNEGVRQPLLAIYTRSALQHAADDTAPANKPARALLTNQRVREVPDPSRATRDIDTREDLIRETTPGSRVAGLE